MSPAASTTTHKVTLADLVPAIGSWCDGTDPSLMTGPDAAQAAEQVAVAVRRLQVKQVALAARAEACNSFSGRFPTAAAWQAHINGCSQSEAKRGLDTVERLDACPEVAAALAAGEISVGEANLVTSAAVMNPGSERRLVAQAKKHNFADTRTAADRARHAAFSREQEQARLARMRRLRRVIVGTDGDGLRHVDTHVVPDDWAGVVPILDAYTDAEFHQARREGRHEDHAAYRADGLLAALRAAGDAIGVPTPAPPCPSRPTDAPPEQLAADAADLVDRSVPTAVAPCMGRPEVAGADETTAAVPSVVPVDATVVRPKRVASPVVLVDAIALHRGYATDTETCELAGSGAPISIDWITDLLPTAAVDVLVHDRNDIRAHAIVHRRRPRPDDAGSGPADLRPIVVVLIDAVALHHPPADMDEDGEDVPVPGTDLHLSRAALRRFVPDDVAEVVEHRLIDMRHYTSATRHLPRPVRLAVLARDRRCTVPGCRNRLGLERDHVHEFSSGGPGDSVNIKGTCRDHHDDKTYRDARVVITATERLWYPPPGTPDHPTHGPIPWRAPLGEHLTRWDLDHLPDRAPGGGGMTLPFT